MQAKQQASEIKEAKKAEKALKKLKKKGTSFFADFKKFINKGNVMNLAIGIVIGSAFTAIVNSLVADIIMPIVSIMFGKNNIAELSWVISETLTINYGKFILSILNFLIVAMFLFLVIRTAVRAENGFSKLKKLNKKAAKEGLPPPPEPAVPPVKIESTEDILKDIRALLTPVSASNSESVSESEKSLQTQAE